MGNFWLSELWSLYQTYCSNGASDFSLCSSGTSWKHDLNVYKIGVLVFFLYFYLIWELYLWNISPAYCWKTKFLAIATLQPAESPILHLRCILNPISSSLGDVRILVASIPPRQWRFLAFKRLDSQKTVKWCFALFWFYTVKSAFFCRWKWELQFGRCLPGAIELCQFRIMTCGLSFIPFLLRGQVYPMIVVLF